jgi:hypothetical protein
MVKEESGKKMKLSLFALLVLPGTLIAGQLPDGITLSITLKNANDHRLVITPVQPVTMVLTFSNLSKAPIRLRIHDYDPFHKKLPYPTECAVRITDSAGKLHPLAKENGEWWSQFICWSTTFNDDDEHNYRTLKSGEALIYEVALKEVLSVPAGGEPKGWPYDHGKGFKPGNYRFQFRFDSVQSEMFELQVDERTKKKA